MTSISMQGLVPLLLSYETVGSPGLESDIEAAERVSEKLRVHLAKTIGREGFRTLLQRALALTSKNHQQLASVKVDDDGSLVGFREAFLHGDGVAGHSAATDGEAKYTGALIIELLDLLSTFIGEDLTFRILKAIWPQLIVAEAAEQDG